MPSTIRRSRWVAVLTAGAVLAAAGVAAADVAQSDDADSLGGTKILALGDVCPGVDVTGTAAMWVRKTSNATTTDSNNYGSGAVVAFTVESFDAGLVVGAPAPGTVPLPPDWRATSSSVGRESDKSFSLVTMSVPSSAVPGLMTRFAKFRAAASPTANLTELKVTAMVLAADDARCVTAPPDPTNRAPMVATAADDASGDEGDTLSTSGSFSDPDNDALTITQTEGPGVVTDHGGGRWSWSLATDDDTAASVSVRATDPSGLSVEDTFAAVATNVAPALGAVSVSNTGACAVTMAVSFTDPGTADTHTAVIDWGDGTTEDAGATLAGGVSRAHGYAGNGPHTVRVTVTDDDGGEDAAQGTASTFGTASAVLSPIKPSGASVFKLGSSVPVKIEVLGCDDEPVKSLTPTVSLRKVDNVPASDPAVTADPSAVPTNGKQMLWNGEHYHYVLSTKSSEFAGGAALTAGTYEVALRMPASSVWNPTVLARFDLKK